MATYILQVVYNTLNIQAFFLYIQIFFPIAAHTDNTSQSEPSGLICFHNTIHTGEGGKSLLMDGFNIVENLRQNHPDTLERLSTVNIKQQYVKDGQIHFHTAPVIGLDPVSGLPEIMRFVVRLIVRIFQFNILLPFHCASGSISTIVLRWLHYRNRKWVNTTETWKFLFPK